MSQSVIESIRTPTISIRSDSESKTASHNLIFFITGNPGLISYVSTICFSFIRKLTLPIVPHLFKHIIRLIITKVHNRLSPNTHLRAIPSWIRKLSQRQLQNTLHPRNSNPNSSALPKNTNHPFRPTEIPTLRQYNPYRPLSRLLHSPRTNPSLRRSHNCWNPPLPNRNAYFSKS